LKIKWRFKISKKDIIYLIIRLLPFGSWKMKEKLSFGGPPNDATINISCLLRTWVQGIVVTYEIRLFFEGAQKEVFSSIFLKAQKNVKYAYV
jgi:hypothetical protein